MVFAPFEAGDKAPSPRSAIFTLSHSVSYHEDLKNIQPYFSRSSQFSLPIFDIHCLQDLYYKYVLNIHVIVVVVEDHIV